MRCIIAFIIISVSVLSFPGLANALPDITINFDDLLNAPQAFSNATALRNRYASKGVIFYGPDGLTGNDGGAILSLTPPPLAPLSGLNALVFNDRAQAILNDGGIPTWPETITFDTLWANVSIYVASTRTDMDHFSLIALDGSGKQVGMDEVDTKNDWAQLSVSWAGGIKSVVLSMDKKGNDAFAADNLELTTRVVPEPGTMLLLGLGVIGIGILRRKN
jgi:hypothetical protein